MKKVMVRLKDADEIKNFNKVVSRFDCDFDLQLAKNMIDAKSLLGLFALQFNTALTPIYRKTFTDSRMRSSPT